MPSWMTPWFPRIAIFIAFLSLPIADVPPALAQDANTAQINVHLDQPAKPISPDLFGIFFEDLNYAADGGLYGELVQNGSFEYSAADSKDWGPLSFWQFVSTGQAKGSLAVEDANALHANNPNYLVLRCDNAAANEEVGIANNGFDGIAVKAGETYDFSAFARRRPNEKGPVRVRLESADGTVLARADLPELTTEWAKYSASVVPDKSDPNARLVLSTSARGYVFLDMVSLFPHKTFKDHPNGLRADLAQTIADLKPRFVRFPGGCLAHGDGIKNIYRWKDTIGPVERRRQQKNIWRYHQSVGLGYFEYFQFCEDIGAAPLPVVAAGVSCQNSDMTRETGQQCIPMDQMPAYVQDILDLIEYANGPATSTWGAKRVAAAHPAPFNLKYLGIGNEDAMTPGFEERFKILFDAVRQKHPEITVVGTVGPRPDGRDFDEGWKLAGALSVPIVDEHYYMPPEWFLKNQARYDHYDRSKSHVYVGEYASRGNTLRNALSEAVHMTSMERNGDVVQMASYAPLLCKIGHDQWRPDMIYFNNSEVMPSINYYVQQMFATNMGDAYVPSTLRLSNESRDGQSVAISTVRDGDDLILKLVNVAPAALHAKIAIAGNGKIAPEAKCIVLTGAEHLSNRGDPRTRGNIAEPAIHPVTSTLNVSNTFDYVAPPFSLAAIRIKVPG